MIERWTIPHYHPETGEFWGNEYWARVQHPSGDINICNAPPDHEGIAERVRKCLSARGYSDVT